MRIRDIGHGSLASSVVVDPPATFNLADLFEAVADRRDDHLALVAGDERLSYRSLDDLAARWATVFADLGLGPGDRVALMLANSAVHVAALLGACKQRAVPLNVNQHYTVEELRPLLADADPALVVCADDAAPTVRAALDGPGPWARPPRVRTIGDLEPVVAAALPRARRPDRRGDDRYLLYTGGTTGLPKGVEWRQEDLYFAALGGGDRAGTAVTVPADVVASLSERPSRTLVACPLMHGTAQWVTLGTLVDGGTVVLWVDDTFDATALLDLAEREAAGRLVVVGDAFAVPLADALDREPDRWRLDQLVVVASGGAALGTATAGRLLAHLDGAVVVDGYGTSETGGQARRVVLPGVTSDAGFTPGPDTTLVGPDGAPLPRDDHRLGRIARSGRLPLGYRNDPDRTAATFPVLDGERRALTGDLGRWRPDGTIELVGRGGRTVNSGGEKVDALEVEGVVRSHPAVADAMVVGVPDARFGEVVGVVVTVHPGTSLAPEQLTRHCRRSLARFKVPRHVAVVTELPRTATGKPDYRQAVRRLEDPDPAPGAAADDNP
jgi:fatty-acyl-CoA synthase